MDMPNYQDLLYDVENGVATITINRPDKYNAFPRSNLRGTDRRFSERAGWDRSVGVIVLTGAGKKRFAPAAINRPTPATTMGAG
jgi:2-ketocyclohexanecarboxyl-CoA hydrolase